MVNKHLKFIFKFLNLATFTVLCYNVLCDKYATSSLYSYCPQWALDWEYRKQYIIKEICHYDADIITLQVLNFKFSIFISIF